MLIGARTAAWAGGGGGGAYAYETQYNIFGGTLHFDTGASNNDFNNMTVAAYVQPPSSSISDGNDRSIIGPQYWKPIGGFRVQASNSGYALWPRASFTGNNYSIGSGIGNTNGLALNFSATTTAESFDKVGNVTYKCNEYSANQESTVFYYGNMYVGGAPNFTNHAKDIGIGSVVFKSGDTIIRNFKSVVDNNGVARIWDEINADFVTLDGEGVMTAGPRKTE